MLCQVCVILLGYGLHYSDTGRQGMMHVSCLRSNSHICQSLCRCNVTFLPVGEDHMQVSQLAMVFLLGFTSLILW